CGWWGAESRNGGMGNVEWRTSPFPTSSPGWRMSILPILFFGRSCPRYQKTSHTSSGGASTTIENECSCKGIENTTARATVAGDERRDGGGGLGPRAHR